LIIVIISGCTRDMETCECTKMEIYQTSLTILTPIAVHEKGFRKIGVTKLITDLNEIKRFYKIFDEMNELEDDYGDIDTRILVDLFCKGGGKSTVFANRNIIQSGDKYFEPNSDFFAFFEKIVNKKEDNK